MLRWLVDVASSALLPVDQMDFRLHLFQGSLVLLSRLVAKFLFGLICEIHAGDSPRQKSNSYAKPRLNG